MKTVLYCRVSAVDQTIAHQESQAKAAGFKVDTVVSDNGVPGTSTALADREQGKRLFDMLRAGDTLVVGGSTALAETIATCATTSASS
jgi:putative DNA-invertase from lambdoid prophage Rac